MKIGIILIEQIEQKIQSILPILQDNKEVESIVVISNLHKNKSSANKQIKTEVMSVESNTSKSQMLQMGVKVIKEKNVDLTMVIDPSMSFTKYQFNDILSYYRSLVDFDIISPTVQYQGVLHRGTKKPHIHSAVFESIRRSNKKSKKARIYNENHYKGVVSEVDIANPTFFAFNKNVMDQVDVEEAFSLPGFEVELLCTLAKMEGLKVGNLNQIKLTQTSPALETTQSKYNLHLYYKYSHPGISISSNILKRKGEKQKKHDLDEEIMTSTTLKPKVTMYTNDMQMRGVTKAICTIANMLSKKYDVEIVSLYHLIEPIPFELESSVQVHYLIEDLVPKVHKIHKEKQDHHDLGFFKQRIYQARVNYRKNTVLKKRLRHTKTDVVFAFDNVFFELCGKYTKDAIKISLQHQLYPSGSKEEKRIIKTLRKFDLCLQVSHNLHDYYKKLLIGTKSAYLPLGIDEVPKEIAVRQNKKILTFLDFSSLQEATQLIEIFKNVLLSLPDAKLDILGDGLFKQEVIDLVHTKNLDQSITFHGNREGEEKEAILLASDLYLSVAKNAGYGFSVLEALGHGLPVVCFTSYNQIVEFVEDEVTGYIVPDDDLEMMASRCIKVLNNQLLFNTKELVKVARKYKVSSVKKQWIECIDHCLNSSYLTTLLAFCNNPRSYSEFTRIEALFDFCDVYTLVKDHPITNKVKRRKNYIYPAKSKFTYLRHYFKIKPDVLVVSGGKRSLMLALITRLRNKKVIYIETGNRRVARSLIARGIYLLSNKCIVTKRRHLKTYKKAVYRGGLE